VRYALFDRLDVIWCLVVFFRPTYVHKLIVKHSIEEKIVSLMSMIPVDTAETTKAELPLTIADLAGLFDT